MINGKFFYCSNLYFYTSTYCHWNYQILEQQNYKKQVIKFIKMIKKTHIWTIIIFVVNWNEIPSSLNLKIEIKMGTKYQKCVYPSKYLFLALVWGPPKKTITNFNDPKSKLLQSSFPIKSYHETNSNCLFFCPNQSNPIIPYNDNTIQPILSYNDNTICL